MKKGLASAAVTGNPLTTVTQNGKTSLVPVATYLRGLIALAQSSLMYLEQNMPQALQDAMEESFGEDFAEQSESLAETVLSEEVRANGGFEEGNGNYFYNPISKEVKWIQSGKEYYSDKDNNWQNIGIRYVFFDGDTIHYRESNDVIHNNYINLNSRDSGHKFRMLVAEGGWNPQRETLYGLFIIAASMENRLYYGNQKYDTDADDNKTPDTYLYRHAGTYKSLFTPQNYNGATSPAYISINGLKKYIDDAMYRGKRAVNDFLCDVFEATVSQADLALKSRFEFEYGNKILAYAHLNAILQGSNFIDIPYDKNKCLLTSVKTDKQIFPNFKITNNVESTNK